MMFAQNDDETETDDHLFPGYKPELYQDKEANTEPAPPLRSQTMSVPPQIRPKPAPAVALKPGVPAPTGSAVSTSSGMAAMAAAAAARVAAKSGTPDTKPVTSTLPEGGDVTPRQRAQTMAAAAMSSAHGRNYGGHSLAFMINQEAMTGLGALRKTGAHIPAAGAPSIVKAHIEHPKRLYWIKGKKFVGATAVPVVAASLNSSDVFILDANGTVFVWNGAQASALV
jgi:hypothetical protein